jgi:hypothetical protein
MKKIIYLLLLLISTFACAGVPPTTQKAPDAAKAALTANAQTNAPIITPQSTSTTAEITEPAPHVMLTTQATPSAASNSDGSTTCAANWFFNFDDQHLALADFCPEPAKLLEAVGQDFEGGRVYRYAPDPSYPADQRGTVYVIYNDSEWVTYPDNWDASQPSSDPSLAAPNGRYQPVESIGKVWRDNEDVRERLGWAYEAQRPFQGRMQSYLVQEGVPSGDTHYFFIDHGKWGIVLLLNAVDMGPNKWEVAGTYP